jgi:flagellar biosynthetic protein FliQ
MDSAHVIDCSREAIRTALLLGGPLLAVALLVGLVVNIAQTLTQLHEPVVSLVPRLVVVLLVFLMILPWLLGRWLSFTTQLIGSLPDMM